MDPCQDTMAEREQNTQGRKWEKFVAWFAYVNFYCSLIHFYNIDWDMVDT